MTAHVPRLPLSPVHRVVALAAAVVAMVGATVLAPPMPSQASGAQASGAAIFVDPAAGSDSASGAQAAPLRTIQAALDRAQPGTTIRLAPGAYRERPVTRVAGQPGMPITIEGPESGTAEADRYRATLFGTSRILNVDHSWYTLRGFTIDGQEALRSATFPTDPAQAAAFKDSVQASVRDGRLIYIGSADTTRGLTGITVEDMYLKGAGGECIRIRNAATDTVIRNSVITWCGMFAKDGGTDKYRYHNGEGVYIGTSPNSTSQPMYANDTTHGIRVVGNRIHTFGSECVDVKENSYGNLMEANDCSGNTEPTSFNGSLVELRGTLNEVVGNTIAGSLGDGLKIAANSGYSSGGNSARGNVLRGVAGTPVINRSLQAQGSFCGNSVDEQPAVSGTSLGDITAPCASASPSATPTPSPTPSTSASASPSASPSATATASPTTTASPSATATTAPIVVQAESGTIVAPLLVGTAADAEGGRYVVQTASSGSGRVTLRLPVVTAGKYRLEGRIMTTGGDANSFYYSFDGASRRTWDLDEPRSTWTWDVTGPTVTLAAGTHTLTLTRRESGAKLDVIRMVRVG